MARATALTPGEKAALFEIVNRSATWRDRGPFEREKSMTKSKKEHLAWVNGGMMGTSWRAETIEEAVRTCVNVAAQDWGGLRGTEVVVGVYDVTGHDKVILAGHRGEVLTEDKKELPPLFLVKVDVPTLRKNGDAYGDHYRRKVADAARNALQKTMAKLREEKLTAAAELFMEEAVQDVLA